MMGQQRKTDEEDIFYDFQFYRPTKEAFICIVKAQLSFLQAIDIVVNALNTLETQSPIYQTFLLMPL